MLTREQVYTMLMLRSRGDNIFSTVPSEILQAISDCGQDPKNDISKALRHAAYARKEDVEALLVMLAQNPSLLLQAGNVKTPGGLEVQRVTIYEFLLGAGDFDFANLVVPFFSRIPHGQAEQQYQLARYRPHLENILKQVPYDCQPIFNLLLNNKASIHQDVSALLANNFEHKSELSEAILAFRKAHVPTQPLIKPRMHFNYATQNALFQLLYDNVMREKLHKVSGDNYDRTNVIWRIMICHLMNFYPGIDRCITAQGIASIYSEAGSQVREIERSYQTQLNKILIFPNAGNQSAESVLGQHFGISIYGQRVSIDESWGQWRATYFQAHYQTKASKAIEHLRTHTTDQQNRPGV